MLQTKPESACEQNRNSYLGRLVESTSGFEIDLTKRIDLELGSRLG